MRLSRWLTILIAIVAVLECPYYLLLIAFGAMGDVPAGVHRHASLAAKLGWLSFCLAVWIVVEVVRSMSRTGSAQTTDQTGAPDVTLEVVLICCVAFLAAPAITEAVTTGWRPMTGPGDVSLVLILLVLPALAPLFTAAPALHSLLKAMR